MPKGRNYSAKDFNKIKKELHKLGINNIDKLETFAIKMKREPWSLYCFIHRKLSFNVLPDRDIKKQFRIKHNTIKPPKKDRKPKKKIIHFQNTGSFKRPPAEYSNMDVVKWADSLLD